MDEVLTENPILFGVFVSELAGQWQEVWNSFAIRRSVAFKFEFLVVSVFVILITNFELMDHVQE